VSAIHRYTPLRVSIPFILGISLVLYFRSVLPIVPVFFAIFFLLTALLFHYLWFGADYRLRWLPGLLASSGLFLAGICLVLSIKERNDPAASGPDALLSRELVLCSIEQSPMMKSATPSAQVKLLAGMDSTGRWTRLKAKARLYFREDSLARHLHYGDVVVFSGNVRQVQGPSNPFVFDFKRFLNDQQVYYQAFVEKGSWRHAGKIDGNPLSRWAEICRDTFLDVFREFGIEGQEFALAGALLLGSRDYLERETEQEFSNAGAVHVLSVSGLHVGIMYVVADKLLFFLKRQRATRKLHHILIICFIWAYAFISGLPSSVVRAALMFSLVAAGSMSKRSGENYNILAISAFIQLWINPFEITSVGFQLSYLAVLGIFAFYQPLNELVKPVNRPVVWIWSIVAVSLAAQLLTFPLGCLNFHMFPVYFLVTNMLVVPLAAIITYFAVFLLVAGAVGVTPPWLAWPFDQSLHFMLKSVEFIQSWPGAVIQPIVFTDGQVVVIYLFIMALFVFTVISLRKWIFILCGCVVIFLILTFFIRWEKLSQDEIVIYNIPGFTAVDMVHNRETSFLCSEELLNNQKKIDFQVKPNRIRLGTRQVMIQTVEDTAFLHSKGSRTRFPFVDHFGKTIVFIGPEWKYSKSGKIEIIDLAVIYGNINANIGQLSLQCGIKQVVIDSSVPSYRSKQLIADCSAISIPCHCVQDDGAFVMKW
jgi:competence protein ComEC